MSDVGEGIKAIGLSLFAAEAKVRKSDESFRRSSAITEFEEETTNELRELGLSGDLSNPEQSAAFGQSMAARIEDLKGRFGGGSEDHQNRLSSRLDVARSRIADKASIMAADIRKKKTGALIGQDLNRLTAQMNDGSLTIDDAFARLDEIIDDQADSMAVPDEIAFRQSGRAMLVVSRFENFMGAGAIEDAESLLEEPGVAAILSPELQTSLDKRITEAKREAGKLIKLGRDQRLIDPATRKVVVPAEKKEEKLVEIGDATSPTGSRFVKESEAEGKPGRPRKPLLVQNLGENAFLKRLGEKDADRVDNLASQAALAQQNLTEITRLRAAIKSGKFITGLFANTRQLISQLAALMEIPGGEISPLIGDAATADTIDSAAALLGIQIAQQGGRITNLFLNMIRDSLPALTRTPEGNLILIDVMERQAERIIELSALSESFTQEHDSLRPKDVPTFFDAVRKLEKDDPVITPELLERIKKTTATAPKSFKELVGDVLGDDGDIAVPAAFADKPDGTEIRQKSTGQLFEKRGDRMFPVE